MYTSQNNKNTYNIYANNPFSEFLSINASDENEVKIKKESTTEFTYKNISSVLLYEKQYLIKTCYGPNRIMEVLSQDDIESKKETLKFNYIFTSTYDFDTSDNLVFCYTSIINNPDKNFPDKKAIITIYSEKNTNNNLEKKYAHKYILFFPESEKFSNSYSFHSDNPTYISNIFPKYCTTFRETDIFCTINDEKYQFVLETKKMINDNEIKPSLFLIKTNLTIGDGKNLRPISLNYEYKSILGGFYDTFLLEYHNKDKNETSIIYSLYRKSVRYSLVPVFDNLNLFSGISLKDGYVGYNLLNYLMPNSNEIIFIYIYNNMIQATRVDYSGSSLTFKKLNKNNLGYYTSKIDDKCKSPKYLQSTYINNYIKYNSIEQFIVNNKIKNNYIYQKDIEILLSCASSNNGDNSEVFYTSTIIEIPQCLFDLDSIHGLEIHKINFYLEIKNIIYDVYAGPKLKSFRNVGIKFYPIENYFKDLIKVWIKESGWKDYHEVEYNTLYLNITHIKFERIHPYVPYFKKPFYLNYRLVDLNLNNNNPNIQKRMQSNLCSFQIKFFPYISPYNYQTSETSQTSQESQTGQESQTNTIFPDFTDITEGSGDIIIPETCNVGFCAICSENLTDSCRACDTSEIPSLIIENDSENNYYNKCICDTSLGFLKEPDLENKICLCQEDYYYYKSMNLCWEKEILENGPYYKEVNDFNDIPIYDDCYYTCKKCSKAKDENSHNCLQCQDGYAYIDDDISNCYDINDLRNGYHQVDNDHFIKCHDNCVSCTQKSEYDAVKNEINEFCTECKKFVPFKLKENFLDETFNCLEKQCDLNEPSLLYSYYEGSYECIKNCENGVQPYNSNNVCWKTCTTELLFLDKVSKKCYANCNFNENHYLNYATGTCEDKCLGNILSDNTCNECNGNINQYKNKNGVCVGIPKGCLTVDINTGLCKKCKSSFYPLKEDINKESFNCYQNLEEISEVKNKTNYYLNDTNNYWEECYETCETCESYGSENRQRCNTCKNGYHLAVYFIGNELYSNCQKTLTTYENCSSTQKDIYINKDFCHFCKEGYSFVYNNNTCMSDEELKNGPFYEDKIDIIKDYDTNETIKVTIYYPCHKNCKSCKEKGDFYDNKCLECKNGYKFVDNNKKICIKSDEELNTDAVNDSDYVVPSNKIEESEEEDEDDDEEEEKDCSKKSWFKLGDKTYFYIYKQYNCYIITYGKQIFFISNKGICNSICPNWKNNNIIDTTCELKKYKMFKNMTREEYNSLINNATIYDEIKNNISIILPKEINKTFHLTNFVSESPNNLSSIHIKQYENDIKMKFNIPNNDNLLLLKVDIKRNITNSTQVEYKFYNPNNFNHLNIGSLFNRRRLDNENGNSKLEIDLPVDWEEEQISKIDELSQNGINAFDSSSDFYLDNCNQYTTQGGNDMFLDDRKKNYYPDMTLCEDGCVFSKYNNITKKITCNCTYKDNTNNYEKVVFVKNEVDPKFKKSNFLENLQSMKCISKIFKPENLKKNPGFVIMILFIVLFVTSGLIYLLFIKLNGVKEQIDEIFKDDNLKRLLNDKKQNLFDSPEQKNNMNVLKFSDKGDDSVHKNDNNKNINDNSKQSKGENIISNSRISNKSLNKKDEKNEILIINDNNNQNGDNNDINNNQHDNDNNNEDGNNVNNNENGDNNNNNNNDNGNIIYIKKNKSEKKSQNDDGTIPNDNSNKKNQELISNNSSSKKELISNNSNSVGKSSDEPIINNEENKENNDNQEKNNDNNNKKNNENDENDNDEQEIEFGEIYASNAQLNNSQNPNNNENNNNNNENNNNNNNENNNNNNNENNNNNNIDENNNNENNNIDENNNNENNNIDENCQGNININMIMNNTNNNGNDNKNNNNKNNINNDDNNDDNNDENELSIHEDKKSNIDFKNNNNNLIDSNIENDDNYKIEEIDSNEIQTQQNDKNNIDKKSKSNKKEDILKNIDSEGSFFNYGNKYQAFDQYSVDSKGKEKNDILSEFDLESNIANPPRRENNFYIPSSRERISSKRMCESNSERNFIIQKKKLSNSCSCLSNIKKCFRCIISCDNSNSEESFKKFYIEDLKKHHIIFYTFFNCGDRQNTMLKYSFFAFSIHLYFGLNTILTFNLSMAESYFNKTLSKPGFIAMNLLLPFVICGLISFIIKLLIMPEFFMKRVEKKIKNDDKLIQFMKEKEEKNNNNKIEIKEEKVEEKKEELAIEKNEGKKRKRDIKNKRLIIQDDIQIKSETKLFKNLKHNKEYQEEKNNIKNELINSWYKSYKKRIIIYFAVCLFIMSFNWYMMTSFCSIYRNTGVKLLVNSFISLFVSFVIPFILGLIPSIIRLFAVRTENKVILKIYEIINFII